MSFDSAQEEAQAEAALAAARDQDRTQAVLDGDKVAAVRGQPNPIADWIYRLPHNITVGVMDAAVNTVDAVNHFGDALDKNVQTKQRAERASGSSGGAPDPAVQDPQAAREAQFDPSQLEASHSEYNAFRQKFQDFRNDMAMDDTLSDKITQGIAQFAVPMLGWSKALGVTKALSLPGLAAEAATASTALEAHSGRTADLLAQGKQMEGALGTALNTIAPDGSLLNSYINYMTDRSDESEAAGRLKNVLDTVVATVTGAALLHTGMTTLKAVTMLPHYVANSSPAPLSGGFAAQRGAVGDLSSDRGLRLVQQLHGNDHAQGGGIQYNVKSDIHTATSDNGVTAALQQGKNLRILSSETWKGQGQGEGTARIERLVREASLKGLTVTSDSQVSAPAQRVYERLRRAGYDVKENPSRLDPGTGEKFSTSELKGVYEVRPKVVEKPSA